MEMYKYFMRIYCYFSPFPLLFTPPPFRMLYSHASEDSSLLGCCAM